MKATYHKKAGFTLVEIMVVTGVIGLLSIIAIPNFAKSRGVGMANRYASDVRTAMDAFVVYSLEHGSFPADAGPGMMPNGMSEYLKGVKWDKETALGGYYDWDTGVAGVKAGVSVDSPTAGIDIVTLVDRIIDNGDLGSGTFRDRGGGYICVIQE